MPGTAGHAMSTEVRDVRARWTRSKPHPRNTSVTGLAGRPIRHFQLQNLIDRLAERLRKPKDTSLLPAARHEKQETCIAAGPRQTEQMKMHGKHGDSPEKITDQRYPHNRRWMSLTCKDLALLLRAHCVQSHLKRGRES